MVGKDVLMTKKCLFFDQKWPYFWPCFRVIFSCFWTSWEPWSKMQNSTNTKKSLFLERFWAKGVKNDMATNKQKTDPKSQNGTVFRSFFKVKLVLFRLMLCSHMFILGQNEVLFWGQKWPFWMAQLNMCAKSAKNSPFLTQKTALFWSIWGNLSKRQSKMTILTFFDVFEVSF